MQLQFKLSLQPKFYSFVTQLPINENCFIYLQKIIMYLVLIILFLFKC